MKIPHKHFVENIQSKPSINELSERFFQLGHEHEISDEIFNFELTPNRGDCISLDGLLRDLRLFYEIDINKDIYEPEIRTYSLSFNNNAKKVCSNISFLKLEIEDIPSNYKGDLKSYFIDLNLKKINFFTDISNFISYETGQPTHCYDFLKIKDPITLDFLSKKVEFETLLGSKICIDENELVFLDNNMEVINFAGIVGGKNTSCNKKTKHVLLECAYFEPEAILGRPIKYNITSDAAYKFERNTDKNNHDYVLRRFLNIVENHTKIINVELFSESKTHNSKKIFFDIEKIKSILGVNLDDIKCKEYLRKLGFIFKDNSVLVPSYRNDISNINDLSEEIARAIGYDNINTKNFKISIDTKGHNHNNENKLKKLLIDKGFYEVINNPFSSKKNKNSFVIDNPLDKNKNFLRTDLLDSLIDDLIYNENRQKDIIKLFEIADIYVKNSDLQKRVIGIIASGRIGKNYKEFNKKIDLEYLSNFLNYENLGKDVEIVEISREKINSKSKNKIFYLEIELDSSLKTKYADDYPVCFDINSKKYIQISDFPCSTRDLSFSIKKFSNCKILEKAILSFENDLLKEVFIFDYYKNDIAKEIKVGIRFIFQSKFNTIKDEDVNEVMDEIIKKALSIDSVTIPGLEI